MIPKITPTTMEKPLSILFLILAFVISGNIPLYAKDQINVKQNREKGESVDLSKKEIGPTDKAKDHQESMSRESTKTKAEKASVDKPADKADGVDTDDGPTGGTGELDYLDEDEEE